MPPLFISMHQNAEEPEGKDPNGAEEHPIPERHFAGEPTQAVTVFLISPGD